MELTPELVQKHVRRLVEASTTVRSYTKRSKTGKVFNVKQHSRETREALNTVLDGTGIGKSSPMGAAVKSFLVGKISRSKLLRLYPNHLDSEMMDDLKAGFKQELRDLRREKSDLAAYKKR